MTKRGRAILIAATLPVLGVVARPAGAAELFWDADGTAPVGGGAGTWTTAGTWATDATGSSYTSWNNANGDSATFGGTVGSVALGGNVTVNVITTNAAGYAFTGSTLTFSGANAGIHANHTTGTTTLSALYTGASLTKTGPGRVDLNSSTNTIGKYNLNGGYVTIAAINRLGTAPVSLVADYFHFNGGGFSTSVATGDLGATRGVTIGAGGAFFGAPNTTNAVTISAPVVGTAGGSLNVSNAGPFYSPHAGGGIWILSNTANSWNGATNVTSGGTLRLGAAGVIPDGSAVSVAGTFDNNNNAETIGSLTGAGAVTNVAALTVGGNNTSTTYSGAMSGATGTLTKVGTGTLTLSGSGANTRAGATSVNAGTLSLSKTAGVNAIAGNVTVGDGSGTDTLRLVNSNQIANTANMTLNGGTFNVDSEDETLGTLDVDGTSTINFGTGTDSILAFADSSGIDWTGGLLQIINWSGLAEGGGTEGLFFGSSASALTAQQLSQIQFVDANAPGGFYAASILSSGEVVAAIPEPGSAALILLAGSLVALRRSRKQ